MLRAFPLIVIIVVLNICSPQAIKSNIVIVLNEDYRSPLKKISIGLPLTWRKKSIAKCPRPKLTPIFCLLTKLTILELPHGKLFLDSHLRPFPMWSRKLEDLLARNRSIRWWANVQIVALENKELKVWRKNRLKWSSKHKTWEFPCKMKRRNHRAVLCSRAVIVVNW